jgi:hypothetical protein
MSIPLALVTIGPVSIALAWFKKSDAS